MRYIIQNLIFPDYVVCSQTDMYYRKKGYLLQQDDTIIFGKNSIYESSTYFNSFSLNKWLKYTKLKNLTLSLRLKGSFRVEIYSAYWFQKKEVRECLGTFQINNDRADACEFPIDISHNDSVYFRLIACEENAVFYGGYYFTDINQSDLNHVNIDLVMCTFKREKYVKRNIDLIVNKFLRVSTYNGANHFRIKVVDNGQTLETNDIEIPDLVQLYPNINVGGSGGFCRGMIESLHDDFSTHILFMDDDVLVQVEAFEKTYNFLTLLKDDYKNDFLGGAMLRADQKNIQHENLAGFKGDHLVSLKQNLDLNKYTNVLFNEKEEYVQNVYAAWWYCCMPRTVVNLDNLPLPFFIRMDDIEYSIRNVKNVISLNGVSVWHEAFDKKYSALMENYFMFRNNMVVNLVHDTGNKKQNLKFFMHRFLHDIFCYDYGGAELLLDGMENFLKGPEFFKTIDTCKDLKIHSKKTTKLRSINAFKKYDMLYERFKADTTNKKERKIKKMIRWITCNGHFLPNMFFSNIGFATYGYGMDAKQYFTKRNVLACDSNFDMGVELSINRRKCLRLCMRWLKISILYYVNWKKLNKEYKMEFHQMKGKEFWDGYLKI